MIAVLTVDRAAIRCMGLVFSVPRPGRHGDVIRLMVETFGEEVHDACFTRDQGFVLSDGSFADRMTAWRLAERSGQLLARAPTDGCGGVLYSEDVW